jgi:hypothetical protein
VSPRLLLWEPEPRARLRTVAALRGLADVLLADDPSENPVRLVRRLRPELMLLALGRGRLSPGLQSCRVIKTDQGRPPRVGLTDRWSRLRDPDQALVGCDGDGYLGGVPDAAALRMFVADLMAGRRPVHLHPPEPGLLGRLLTRGRRT